MQRKSSGGIQTWLITALGLGLVWTTVMTGLPTEQELTAIEPARSVATAAIVKPASTPVLDLTVPISPPLPSQEPLQSEQRPGSSLPPGSLEGAVDPRVQQITKLKCEADIEQLCPASSEGAARRRCVEEQMHQLAAPCQQLLRERFIKWKEERTRTLLACREDVQRFCKSIRPGAGQMLQCLQEHAQEVSDRCYQTLPKGALLFKH